VKNIVVPVLTMPRQAAVNRTRPAVTRVSAERMGQLRVEAAARGQSASEAIRAAEASSARRSLPCSAAPVSWPARLEL
jgi:hypothetical protein